MSGRQSQTRWRGSVGGEEPFPENGVLRISVYSQPTRRPLILLCNPLHVTESFLESIEEGLKAILYNELCNLKVLQRVRTLLAPNSNNVGLTKSSTCLKCVACTTKGKRFCITLTTTHENIPEEEEIVEGILREQLLAQSQLLKLIKKEYPAFVTREEKQKGQRIRLSHLVYNPEVCSPEKDIVETILVCPSWVLDVFRLLGSDIYFEEFTKLGILGIDYYPIANFQVASISREKIQTGGDDPTTNHPQNEDSHASIADHRMFTKKYFPDLCPNRALDPSGSSSLGVNQNLKSEEMNRLWVCMRALP